jgi:hypothetical protein
MLGRDGRHTGLFGAAAAVLAALLVAAVVELPDPDAPPPASVRLSTSVSLHERPW